MKFLKWYSAILATYGMLSMGIEFLAMDLGPYQKAVSLWGIVMWTPVLYYLWRIIRRGLV